MQKARQRLHCRRPLVRSFAQKPEQQKNVKSVHGQSELLEARHE